jgi:hypothetical protein
MSSPFGRRTPLARMLLFALATAVAGAGIAASAWGSGAAAELQPQTLVRAKAIRDHVNARYRRLPGRKLAVTEVTTTGVVESLSLVEDPLEPARVVPADNGIYFQICSVRAKCPYPARLKAWPADAFRPGRLALELAVRTFSRTTATLVVVALPTTSPTWIVFERDDFLAEVGVPLRNQLTADPGYAQAGLQGAVDRIARGRTFVPLQLVEVAPGRETFTAVSLREGVRNDS